MRIKLKRRFILSTVFIVLNSAQIAHPSLDPPSEAFAANIKPTDKFARITLPRYTMAIRQNAAAYGLDWKLIMAIMKQESQFAENALSRRGARGLMQVMPETEVEVANHLGLKNLHHPYRNIRGGTFYFAKLYDLFDRAPDEDRLKLTIASYNAGPGRIYDAQELAAYLGENPFSWQVIEKVLPLLSRRYYTLHGSVWGGGKPRNGYFGKSRQTIVYVEGVLENYERYKSMLD